ncbi:MAG: AAA family ATPase [Desulfobulbaceae bacterium]|nr:AAA family ATPase [Desulfobulbaceae bacterium]
MDTYSAQYPTTGGSSALAEYKAERAVLGKLFLKPELIPQVFAEVQPDHMCGEDTRAICSAMIALDGRGEPVDTVSVLSELGPKLEFIGGIGLLARLPEEAPIHGSLDYYIDLIKAGAARRKLKRLLDRAQNDIADGIDPQEIAADLQKAIEGEAEHQDRRFSFVPASELLTVKPIEWLVTGFLEAGVLAVLFGDPETFKSFIAIDFACSITTHYPWHRHFTKKGPVFIIIGEGQGGYGRRLAAWQKGNMRSLEGAPIFVSTVPAQILDESSAREVSAALKVMREQHGEPVLLIIDTLARNFGPGDENSTGDMTKFINHLDRYIGNSFTRLLIHHSGLGDKTRGRGSSVLKGAVDVEMKTTRRDDGTVELSCTKMKDAPPFPPITFKPEVVVIGQDGEEPITSVYLQKVDAPAPDAPKLSPQMKQALNLLVLMGGEKCHRCIVDWRTMCQEEGLYVRGAFYTMLEKLDDRGLLDISNDCVKLSPLSSAVIAPSYDTGV